MKEYDFDIGASVTCQGERCGRLAKLVMDPHTQRVTHLIVEKGLLLTKDSVVPMGAVKGATTGEVELSIDKESLSELCEYRRGAFSAPPEDSRQTRYPIEDVLYRLTDSALAHPTPVAPSICYPLGPESSTDAAVVERGHLVQGLQGRIGTVHHVLVERETGRLTLLVVDRGLLLGSVVILAELVRRVGDDQVLVALDDKQVQSLRHYAPRDDADLVVELKDNLSRVPGAPDSIRAEVQSGIVRLSGTVPDVRTRRLVEARARSVEGVLHVDNALQTDAGIQASVIATLSADPRTFLAAIDVLARQATVTLKGCVDSHEVRDAAEAIALSQSGVARVVNELTVGEDECTALLDRKW